MVRPVLLIAVLAMTLLCIAETGVANDVVPSAAAGVSAVPKPPRLLVLRDGKVIEGDIRLAQGGYEVAVPGGRFFLSEPFVWFTAASRIAAYAELCERLPDKSANGHVALAQWCIDNRLYSDAQKELKIALQLEPDHTAARKALVSMKRYLTDTPADAATRTNPDNASEVAAASADAGTRTEETASPSAGETMPAMANAAKSGSPSSKATARPAASEHSHFDKPTLGGLPPDAARDFVRRVQPILVNNCSNAGCHGRASQNVFRLQNVRLGNPGFKALTQRNLEAVRAQIAAESPQLSPLLVASQQPGHGGSHRPLFSGPAGQAQFKSLSDWVEVAAMSLPVSNRTPAGDRSADKLFQTSKTEEPSQRAAVERALAEQSTEAIAIEPANDLLRRVLEEEQSDAFDPDEFNRRFAPQPNQFSSTPGDGPTP